MTRPVGDIKTSFRDPVHGMIHVNAIELEIISRPPFQRLRNIRQLGTTYKVYHGAEHTRFGHSLGVMFLVSKAMDKLGSRPPLKGTKEFERLKQLIRLAALMHDLGHGPFSHVGEELFAEGKSHEQYSRGIIKEYYSDIFGKEHIKDLGISVGDVTSLLEKGAHDKHLYFVNNLIDGQLDADKMDYLLRDTHYCGVNYGRYDLERLLDTLVICETANEERVLGVESDGVHAVEEFVFARYWMFLQVYFHKTRRIFDHYLIEYMKEQFDTLPTSLEDFIKLDDNEVLRQIASSNNYWAGRLNQRQPMKEVFVSPPHCDRGDIDRFTQMIDEFRKKFPDLEGRLTYIDRASGSTTKELVNINLYTEDGDEPGEQKIPAIPVLDKHLAEVQPIQRYSIPIQGLTEKNINLLRIYADTNQPGMGGAINFWPEFEGKLKEGRKKWGGES